MFDKYIDLSNFSLLYRFNEEGYNILPEEDLNKIYPLSKEYSEEKWNYWISDKYNHLMQIEGININLINSFCNDCGWGNEKKQNNVISLLIEEMCLNKKVPITFFWSASVAIDTEWDIFTKYWSDFCYSSDDSNIIIPHNSNKAIIYVEDKIWIVDRKECFKKY